MKKSRIFKKLLCFMLCSTFIFSMSIDTHAKNGAQESIIEDFGELERLINEHIEVVDGHYIYDFEYISKILGMYDVTSLNAQTNSQWTNLSLKNAILLKLDTTVLEESMMTRGTYCGRNYATGGWNYSRLYTDQTTTNDWIIRFGKESSADSDAALIFGAWSFLPGAYLLSIPAFLASVGSKWKEIFARDLASNNTRCGVVSDVNSFTGFYTITSQLKWYE